MRTTFQSLTPSVLILAVLACSEATRPGSPGDIDLHVTGGNEQTGLIGQELPQPIVVRVTNQDGRPAPGVLINFVVTAGGGHVFAGSALTNAEGEARERWTLGQEPGDNVVEARSVDPTTGEAIVYAQIHAKAIVALPGEPVSHYMLWEYRSQYRVIGQTVDVRDFVFVYDADGTTIPNPQFTLTADPGLIVAGTTVQAETGVGEVKGMVRLSLAGIRDSFEIGFLPDLTANRWRASYSCLVGNVRFDIDSIINVVALSDSVRQASQELNVQLYSAIDVVIYMQASGTVYWNDGRVTEGPLPDHIPRNITGRLFPQRLDYGRVIQWFHPAFGGTRWSSAFSDGTLPPTYYGGHMCDDAFEDFRPGLLEPIE
jgi:hypothetical protein